MTEIGVIIWVNGAKREAVVWSQRDGGLCLGTLDEAALDAQGNWPEVGAMVTFERYRTGINPRFRHLKALGITLAPLVPQASPERKDSRCEGLGVAQQA